jgi:hypothetical protein
MKWFTAGIIGMNYDTSAASSPVRSENGREVIKTATPEGVPVSPLRRRLSGKNGYEHAR